jgi:hypothetical protein
VLRITNIIIVQEVKRVAVIQAIFTIALDNMTLHVAACRSQATHSPCVFD